MLPYVAYAAVDALNRHVDALHSSQLLARSLASLVDSDRQAAAGRLISLDVPGWLASIFAQAIALFYFWRLGSAARWRDALRRRLASETVARFAFGATLAVIARAATLIPSFYLWRVDRVMGLSHALTRVWILEYVLGTILGMLVAGCIVTVVLWLVDRTHQWYVYTIAGILAVSLVGTLVYPYVVAPLFERYVPLRGPLGVEARAFAARQGYPAIPILVEHRADRISVDPAKTQGMGFTQRIVISGTLVPVSTAGEIDYYVASEVASLDAHDPLNLALIDAAIVIVGTALAVFIADRVRFRRDDDPISRTTLVGALLALIYVPAVIVDHGVASALQLRAATAAVAMTGDRASAVRALVRIGDEQVEEACPSGIGRTLLYRSPPLGSDARAIGSESGCL